MRHQPFSDQVPPFFVEDAEDIEFDEQTDFDISDLLTEEEETHEQHAEITIWFNELAQGERSQFSCLYVGNTPEVIEEPSSNTDFQLGDVTHPCIARCDDDFIWLFPTRTRASNSNFLNPKYANIRTLRVANPDGKRPKSISEFRDLLQRIPTGLLKSPEYGFGFLKELRAIPDAIDQLHNITEIHLVDGENRFRIEGHIFSINQTAFIDVRKQIVKIIREFQNRSKKARAALVNNEVLHVLKPTEFAIAKEPIKSDVVFEFLKAPAARLKPAERTVLGDAIKRELPEIAKEDPIQLYTLRKDIEQVALEEVISTMREMLPKTLTESKWQSFLIRHPFVLNLAFALPVYCVREHAYVGGVGIDGQGQTIADFLFANRSTGNLSIVEIKTPNAKLLAKSTYRSNLFAPSKDLVGAVLQVLDQRFQLAANFTNLSSDKSLANVYPYSIHCIVIVGQTPECEDSKKSFEFYRTSLRDVIVVTFDELLQKLVGIAALFREPVESDGRAAAIGDEIPF
jgi:Domain of unknown function (DUF4263)